MELSISTLTANRLLGKAAIRLSPELRRLKDLVSEVDVQGLPFSILQVVISDDPPRTITKMPLKKGSRLLQIRVGLPSGLTLRPERDLELLDVIGECVAEAMTASSMEAEVAARIREKIEVWKSERSRQRSDN
jgi:hypothetical protein